MSEQGFVSIVGAGPGDPGLFTLRGAQALAEADVVLYDALASPAILRHANPRADVRYVGKRSREHALSQREIEQLMVELAQAGKRVVRLKGGDPFVFGRGSEEAAACRAAGVPFEVVPGITSAIAAPAYAGIPVTHRGLSENFLVVTGHSAEGESAVDWDFAARAGTLLVLMGVEAMESITSALLAAGKAPDTQAAAIRWGSRSDQEVVTGTLATIAEQARKAGLRSPAVIVVGPTAALAGELSWFQPGLLAGRRIVVTRARSQASEFASMLEALGAYVVETPVIRLYMNSDDAALHEAVTSKPDWLFFTSANGVRAAMEALEAKGKDARALAGTRIAAVGQATADALRQRGLRADYVASGGTGAALASELPVAAGDRIVMPVSSLTNDETVEILSGRGAVMTKIAAYSNEPEPLDAQQLREVAEADVITFTSASTARNLREALGEQALAESTRLVSIGPKTSESVREQFGRLDHEAEEPTLTALVEAVKAVLL